MRTLCRPKDKLIAIFDPKIIKGLTAVIFFNFWSSKPWIRNWIRIRVRFLIRTGIRKNAGSGSALNQCGSTTLEKLVYLPFPTHSLRWIWRAMVRWRSSGSPEPDPEDIDSMSWIKYNQSMCFGSVEPSGSADPFLWLTDSVNKKPK